MRERAKNLTLICLGLLGLFILLLFAYRLFGIGIPCPLYSLTGLYCPGCGSFRALAALAQLDFFAAFSYNMLLVILLPFLAIFLGKSALLYLQGKRLESSPWEVRISIILACLAILFGVLRNLPALSFLAPGGLL